jgi:hypothetical protein
VGLTLYNNAVAADSFSYTENSEAFLEDLAAWLAVEHDIHVKPQVKRKLYVSQLVVQAKASLLLWNPKLTFVSAKIESLATTFDGQPRKYVFDGISAYPNDAGQATAPGQFQLDRKWGTDPSENTYFSQAPTGTREHIALLDEIESSLLGTIQ